MHLCTLAILYMHALEPAVYNDVARTAGVVDKVAIKKPRARVQAIGLQALVQCRHQRIEEAHIVPRPARRCARPPRVPLCLRIGKEPVRVVQVVRQLVAPALQPASEHMTNTVHVRKQIPAFYHGMPRHTPGGRLAGDKLQLGGGLVHERLPGRRVAGHQERGAPRLRRSRRRAVA